MNRKIQNIFLLLFLCLVSLTAKAQKNSFTAAEQQQISIATPGLFERSNVFNIDLKALSDGNTVRSYTINDGFFETLDTLDVKGGNLDAEVTIHRTSSYFELSFKIKGEVVVSCDKCLDDMSQPIDTEAKLLVRFGHEYSEEDELVIVAEDDPFLDLSWFIYEFIQLNIPIKHVHAPGKCNPAMIKMLQEHSTTRSSGRDEDAAIDPRWSKLNELKNK